MGTAGRGSMHTYNPATFFRCGPMLISSSPPDWSLSVVSHGHLPQIRTLLETAGKLLDPTRFEVLLTLNLPESAHGIENAWPGRLKVIRNTHPKGFGANHNAALREATGAWVAAVDPDLDLGHLDPFAALASALENASTGIVSPTVLDASGACSDHAREVPTPGRLARRYASGGPASFESWLTIPHDVDWVAGLFMAMRRETFNQLGGFDERFHMYCEDVDLCLRSWNAGLAVRVIPGASVVHPARRRTLKDPRHFLWHLASLVRLWRSVSYREFRRSR